ncbi:MAG: helix-turn-helix domain-containing protein [Phormidium sp. GEM2.Bin31]|nr:MAG: helix-turn-helix domain-containing protein [Phormidium sp. GEM2.Bin31]
MANATHPKISRRAIEAQGAQRMKFSRIKFKRKQKKDKLDLPQMQAQTLMTMGAQLRELRQERSLEIETIARQTLIPARLLRAIEDGDLTKLPEPVYIQGFLRRFADQVGLDGPTYARDFPVGYESKASKSALHYSPISQLRPFHLYILYIFLVVFSVRGLSESVNSDSRSPDSAIPPPQTAEHLGDVDSDSQVGSRDLAAPEAMPSTVTANASASDNGNSPSQPVQVGVTLTDESWIQVVADGETTFEGMLSQGTHSWSASRELTVIAGNAGGVMIAVNGDEAQPMGAPGSVEELTVVADSRGGDDSVNPRTSAN